MDGPGQPDGPDPPDGPGQPAEEPSSRWPRYALTLAVLAVVALLTVWAAGEQAAPPGDAGTDAVRLGPRPGEAVEAYLTRVRTVPPAPPGAAGSDPRLALVEFAADLGPEAAAATLPAAGAVPVQAVVRVPLPRVQTALRRVDLLTADPVPALAGALTQAAGRAEADAAAAEPGRRRAVARAEAAALRARCACLLALVVRVDASRVGALVAAPAVRAADVAPAGTPLARLAVSPLLPEQGAGRPDGATVGPVPDDGPVADPG